MNLFGYKKGQLDLNFASALAERDNPGQQRAKRGSNRVMLVSMAVVAGALAFFLIRKMALTSLEKSIAEHKLYISDSYNIAMYDYKKQVQEAIKEVRGYSAASDTFLDQLSKTKRFEMKWIKEYEDLFKNGVTQNTRLTKIDYDMQTLKLTLVTDDSMKMLQFISELREMKDEDGNALYPEVINNKFDGIKEEGSDELLFEFPIEIKLWVTAKEVVTTTVETTTAAE